MTNFIVKIAYKIESSILHRKFRTFLFNILVNNATRHKKIFDLFMIMLVISTVGILIYEVKHTLHKDIIYFEYFAIFIFILEWLGRLTISFESHKQIIDDFEESQFLNRPYKLFQSIKTINKKKFEYILSPMSIIDLLAILPSYRPLRVLRIFLLFRLFKVLRYTNSLNQFVQVFVEKKMELFLLLTLYLLVIFFSSTVLYIYEGTGLNPKVTSFIDAIYWSFITVSTIGYGDITPMSDAGKSITLVLIITGYTVIAFFTSIVTSTLFQKLDVIKEDNTISSSMKLRDYILVCGYGRSGQVLIENLKKHKYDILVIEKDSDSVSLAESHNLNVIKYDATDINLLKKLNITKYAKYVIALSNSDSVNLSIILSIRSLSKTIPIIARANRFKTKEKLKIAGATSIIDVNETTALVAQGYVNSPSAFEAIDDILIDHKGALLAEIEIFDTSYFIGKKLSTINFHTFNINFIGMVEDINKDKFIFNPDKENTILKHKDILIVIGYERTIKELQTYIQSHNNRIFS